MVIRQAIFVLHYLPVQFIYQIIHGGVEVFMRTFRK